MLSVELPTHSLIAAGIAGAMILAGLLVACEVEPPNPAVIDLASYRQEIAAWDRERLDRLKGGDGYLNLVGLFWLTEGQHTLGASPVSDVPLPAGKAPPLVGTLRVAGGQVLFSSAPGVDVRHNGAGIESILLTGDSTQDADLLTHGSLAGFIIRRGERLALRVRDYEHPALADFPGIQRFPVEPHWRVAATLERYREPRRIAVDTVVEDLLFEPVAPGVLNFTLAGQDFELEAYAEEGDDSFFVLFADATSGESTYAAGRFLEVPWVDEAGMTVIDFNLAYNPPCAFNEFATCPIAPLRNYLPVAIHAGEKYAAELHMAGR